MGLALEPEIGLQLRVAESGDPEVWEFMKDELSRMALAYLRCAD
ncbi:MAG: hypothetical protein ACKVOL_10285 [Novosphingobium sp.]